MMLNPRLGQRVQCWYKHHAMPLHGKIGRIKIVSHGKPRNHGVEIEGQVYSVPCGNLRKVQP